LGARRCEEVLPRGTYCIGSRQRGSSLDVAAVRRRGLLPARGTRGPRTARAPPSCPAAGVIGALRSWVEQADQICRWVSRGACTGKHTLSRPWFSPPSFFFETHATIWDGIGLGRSKFSFSLSTIRRIPCVVCLLFFRGSEVVCQLDRAPYLLWAPRWVGIPKEWTNLRPEKAQCSVFSGSRWKLLL
jgi:hypothetical protein